MVEVGNKHAHYIAVDDDIFLHIQMKCKNETAVRCCDVYLDGAHVETT